MTQVLRSREGPAIVLDRSRLVVTLWLSQAQVCVECPSMANERKPIKLVVVGDWSVGKTVRTELKQAANNFGKSAQHPVGDHLSF